MPDVFRDLAREAASDAGFDGFAPEACLINRYEPGTRLSLHQDKDEQNYAHPVVSVSLGLPATFQFGGLKRSDRPMKVPLQHGDIVVWGGPSRLVYHGVLALKDGEHPLTGRRRFNLTFRKALCLWQAGVATRGGVYSACSGARPALLRLDALLLDQGHPALLFLVEVGPELLRRRAPEVDTLKLEALDHLGLGGDLGDHLLQAGR